MAWDRRELQGRQEIAAHLNRSVRTAQNYERHQELPVYRFPGDKAQVFAYVDELDDWKQRLAKNSATAAAEKTVIPGPGDGTSGEGNGGTETNREQSTWPRSHLAHAAAASVLYVLLYTEAIPLELAYGLDRYFALAVRLTGPVFVWVALSSMAVLIFDWRHTVQGGRYGLLWSVAGFVASATILELGVTPFLPTEPLTQASFQTMPAQIAYLKNTVMYFLPLAVVFMVLPFHFVAAFERDWRRDGSHAFRRALGEGTHPALAGAVYPPPRLLGFLLLAALFASALLTGRLLDNLKPAPNMPLFMGFIFGRIFLYFALGVECWLWYSLTIGELKRRRSTLSDA